MSSTEHGNTGNGAERSKKTQLVYRWVFYGIGLMVLAMGLILNTKSSFGVSPIISVAYAPSEIWHLNFGDASLVMYVIVAGIEYLLKWEKFRPVDLLQIPLSIVFTRFFNLFGAMLPNPEDLGGRILCLVLGIVFTGIGAALSMNARLVPNPGDGIVQALSDRIHKKPGFCKNMVDVICVCATLVIGLVAAGRPVGIGIGTIAAMICVGRVIAAYNALFGKKVARLSGMEGR